VLRTLHGYLTRDLLKVTLLSLVAVTLLMTVLAIIQPLRQMGLAGEQVLQLFVFTLPVMLSFTLPVAALFAATLVYGRFSQDRELLACRASGISTLALCGPALALGTVVTVLSLLLSNFVAPSLQTTAALAQSNLRGLVFNRLRTYGFLDYSDGERKHIIHADSVDPDNDTLYGVLYAYFRRTGPRHADVSGVYLAAASAARLHFETAENGDSRVTIQPVDLSVVQAGEGLAPPRSFAAAAPRFLMPVENPIRERPSWYCWDELLKVLRDPTLLGEVARRLEDIRQRICVDLLTEEVLRAVRAGRPYAGLVKGDETYSLSAPSAAADSRGAAVLSGPEAPAPPAVRLTIRRNGSAVQTVSARAGRVVTDWSRATGEPEVTVRLDGDVEVAIEGPAGRHVHREREWLRGQIPMPAELRRRSAGIRLTDVYARPEEFTTNPKVLKEIDYLRRRRIPRLADGLIAELHSRVAYGVSCFLMVAMGAALGLIFRGGQFISAFAISAVPAASVITLLMMGKGMVRNHALPAEMGLACIWGGIAALLAANVLIYWRLARR